MSWIDIIILLAYMAVMLGVGFFFAGKNKSADDYYVGGRSLGSVHVGLSVVATDVGGGFSIGLGGLGFLIGLSGSWMLFTGLIGAWLSGVFLIPKINALSKKLNLLTFPQVFKHYYNKRVALLAGIISAIGYLGFTSSQLLAGAKLASSSFGGLDLQTALVGMGVVAVGYTAVGGMKAVIYTDTLQWIILIAGLLGIGIPLGYMAIGGIDAIQTTLAPEFLSLRHITWQQLVNWFITIVPIWFVGMTLYQRIYACRDVKTAQRAWFIAGLLEWPVMALMGVLLGLFARVAFSQGMFTEFGYGPEAEIDPEIGLPLFLRGILPVGLLGLMMSAYFSAILSTADSCLIAASGNINTDIYQAFFRNPLTLRQEVRISQVATLCIGSLAIFIALFMTNVLSLMLLSYSFMVSGLLVPLVAAIFFRQQNPRAAIASMLAGVITVLIAEFFLRETPWGLDPNFFGILISCCAFLLFNKIFKHAHHLSYSSE